MKKSEKRSAAAATFVIDRRYDASPARVFAAFSESGQREEGTRDILNSLERELARKASEP